MKISDIFEATRMVKQGDLSAHAEKLDMEDIEYFAQAHGSAADFWLPAKKQAELLRLMKSGKKAITKSYDLKSPSTTNEKIKAWIKSQEAKGYKVFARENNANEAFEVIMIEK